MGEPLPPPDSPHRQRTKVIEGLGFGCALLIACAGGLAVIAVIVWLLRVIL